MHQDSGGWTTEPFETSSGYPAEALQTVHLKTWDEFFKRLHCFIGADEPGLCPVWYQPMKE